MSGNHDWQLVERIADGDDHAFEALMESYKKPVLSFLYRFLNSPEDAEDVAQDVFVKVYQVLSNNGLQRKNSAFSTWLFQVARNAAIDRIRWRKRHCVNSSTSMEESGWDDIGEENDPHEKAKADELVREIANAFSKLPEKQRTALLLFEYEDLSYNEIAKIMECRKKSVENHIYRARKFLRHYLPKYI